MREIVGAFRRGASVNSGFYREADVQARDSKRHVKENKGSILDGPFVGGLARGFPHGAAGEGQTLPLSRGIERQGCNHTAEIFIRRSIRNTIDTLAEP